MMKASVRLFAFFVIVFYISGINGQNNINPDQIFNNTQNNASTIDPRKTCKFVENECETDDDCCNKNCRRSITLVRKYCKTPVMKWLRNALPLFPKDKLVTCMYNPVQDRVLENVMNTNLGASAGNSYLDAGTRVVVAINETETDVTINERSSNGSDILMLSEFAAKKLGLVQPGSFECELYVPFWINHTFLRRTMYMIPIIGVLFLLVQIN